MNRYEIENAVNRVMGYYKPPSPSDHIKRTVEERFESAKRSAIGSMRKQIEDIENITIEQCFPKYGKST